MKLYYTAIKALVILFSVFSVNLLYGGDDDFSVTVTEKKVGTIVVVEICYNSIEELLGFRVPSFKASPSGVASPTFNLTFEFDDQIPPDGRIFKVHAYVYIENSSGGYTPVQLNNSVFFGNYAVGNTGTSQGGEVSLSVTPNFNVLSNCSYYFKFQVIDITPQLGGGSDPNSEGPGTMGGNSGGSTVISPYTMTSPFIELTKDNRGCLKYTQRLCAQYGGNASNTSRTSPIHSNSQLSVFPNPTSNGKVVLQLDFEEQISRNLNIEVLNTQGQLMKREQVHVTAAQTSLQQKLDMRELPAGIYLIKVDTGTEQLIQKLVIQ